MNTEMMTFTFIAILFWGVAGVLDKLTVVHGGHTGAFFGKLLFTILIFLPIIIWKMAALKSITLGLNKTAVGYIIATAVVTNLGLYFYLKAMHYGEASRVTALLSSFPLITLVIAVIALGEKFTMLKTLGTLLIFAGVYCLNF